MGTDELPSLAEVPSLIARKEGSRAMPFGVVGVCKFCAGSDYNMHIHGNPARAIDTRTAKFVSPAMRTAKFVSPAMRLNGEDDSPGHEQVSVEERGALGVGHCSRD
jgi:hypothetical protein